MSSTAYGKRARVLMLVVAMSVLLTATTVSVAKNASSEFIRADEGGVINIEEGVLLVIPPEALEEDTLISAVMMQNRNRIAFHFKPHRLEFLRPVYLCVSWQVIDDIENTTLYGKEGEAIEPQVYSWGVSYPIWHFSLYYYRRR